MVFVELLFTISVVEICVAYDGTLTINVLPGQRECFAHEIAANCQYELEYQVRFSLVEMFNCKWVTLKDDGT